jgi:N-methylhydantoinase A
MLLSDLKHDYVRTLSGELASLPRQKIHELYVEMEAEALKTLAEEGMKAADVVLSYAVDLKYIGQFHEVTIPFASLAENLSQMQESFDAQHRKLYGYNLPGQSVEALHWRLTAIGRTERPQFGRAGSKSGGAVSKRSRDVIFDGRKVVTDVYDGSQLNGRTAIQGPAIIEEPTTTVVVPPDCRLVVNEFGDYELSL